MSSLGFNKNRQAQSFIESGKLNIRSPNMDYYEKNLKFGLTERRKGDWVDDVASLETFSDFDSIERH